MQDQTAILVEDHGEWIFVTVSEEDEPERVWKDLDAATKELWLEGWEVVQGPALVQFDIEEFQQYEGLAYRLRRRIQ